MKTLMTIDTVTCGNRTDGCADWQYARSGCATSTTAPAKVKKHHHKAKTVAPASAATNAAPAASATPAAPRRSNFQ